MSFNERHKNVDTRPAGKARDLSRHGDVFKYLPEWREGIQQLTPQNESVRSPFLKLDEISGMSPIQGHELQRFLFYSSASCGWAFLSSGFLLSSQRSQVLIGDEPLTLQFPPFSLSHPPTPFPLHFRQVIWPSVSLVLLWKFLSLSLSGRPFVVLYSPCIPVGCSVKGEEEKREITRGWQSAQRKGASHRPKPHQCLCTLGWMSTNISEYLFSKFFQKTAGVVCVRLPIHCVLSDRIRNFSPRPGPPTTSHSWRR